jgi:hypothetical protein
MLPSDSVERRQKSAELFRKNLRASRSRWSLSRENEVTLRAISDGFQLSIGSGHLVLLNQSWYITHAGLLHIAHQAGCHKIHVSPVTAFCDLSNSRWAFRARVYKSANCGGFTGFGDADPANVSPLVRGAEMRIAETRAVNRALRKAYGIGLCSVEEIASTSGPLEPATQANKPFKPSVVNANGNGHHLRDRLLVLIRQQKLDGTLVKAYAADFCNVKELRDASKEQIQQFIDHLSKYVSEDSDGLLCQLNSYGPKQESAA